MKTFAVKNLQQTNAAGIEIASLLEFPGCVYLQGEMGAGKTTLCQSIVKHLGYSGSVTSPSYNLIHEYVVNAGVVYHLDLYRLENPSELEYLAIADLWQNNSLFLIEWPENGRGYLPAATHNIAIDFAESIGKTYRCVKFCTACE